MAQKTTTATAVEEKKKEGFWSTKITGVSLPLYLIMVLVLIIAMALGKLPTNMIGPIAVLVIFGNLFHFIGTKIPIVKSYLGALISMVVSFFAVGLVGMLIGNGFANSVLYISLPAMAGGVGAGAVPLSTIYANVLGTDASSIISRLIPATAMTNVLAIIGAALVARAGQSMPKFNGNGKLMEKGDLGDGKPRTVKPSIPQLGVGLMVSLTFFILGQIGNYFVPKVHAYAFMIIIVVICKIANLLPEYYEDAAIMFNNLIVKNLTAAVLAGIGIALLNLNVLASALTWQFVVLCLTSVIAISVVSGFVGRLFGLYPIESTITAGLCNNSMGGTGNVAVLSAANRMELIAFAQMGNRLGGAIVLIISGFLMQLLS